MRYIVLFVPFTILLISNTIYIRKGVKPLLYLSIIVSLLMMGLSAMVFYRIYQNNGQGFADIVLLLAGFATIPLLTSMAYLLLRKLWPSAVLSILLIYVYDFAADKNIEIWTSYTFVMLLLVAASLGLSYLCYFYRKPNKWATPI